MTKTAKISGRLPTIIPIFVSIVRRRVCLRFRFHPFTTCNEVALLVTQNLSAVTQRERASVKTALAWRWAVIWTKNMVLASPFQPKLDRESSRLLLLFKYLKKKKTHAGAHTHTHYVDTPLHELFPLYLTLGQLCGLENIPRTSTDVVVSSNLPIPPFA